MAKLTTAGMPVVYVIAEHEHAPLCKIGVTTNLARRLSALRTASPLQLRVIYTWDMPLQEEASHFEGILLQRFRSYTVRGEWFKISPRQLLRLLFADFRTEQACLHRRWLQLNARATRVRTVWQQAMWDKQDWARAERVYNRIWNRLDRIRDTQWSRTMQIICACTMHAWRDAYGQAHYL